MGAHIRNATKTLAGELTAAGDTWKAYVQGVPSNAKSACRVPKVGSKVPQTAGSKNAYLAWRNPFLYFRSLTSGSAVPRRRGRSRAAQDRSEEREHNALARLHHPGAVLGWERGAV